MTKPVEATSGQATVGPYYNINEYSGQLYKWSVERLSPDNLVCLPIGCLGVLVSLVTTVVEGALMLVVNLCIAVKGVVWGHTVTVIAPTANGNTNPANPPAAEETGKGKKAKTKEEPMSSKPRKAAKNDDAEEATPTKKTGKKSAPADKKVETDDVDEESGDEGNVSDTEESSSADESSASGSEETESESEEEIIIPKIPKPDLGALSEDEDRKTASPVAPSSASKPFRVDWHHAGRDAPQPKWTSLNLKPIKAPKPLSEQPSFITKERAKQFGGAALAGVAATVAGFSLPVIAPFALAGALATRPGLVSGAWQSLRNLGPNGCKATRNRAREEEDDDVVVTHPVQAAPQAGQTIRLDLETPVQG